MLLFFFLIPLELNVGQVSKRFNLVEVRKAQAKILG